MNYESLPRLELLEDHMMLASFAVTFNSDFNAPDTLRYAINQVNGSTDPSNSITFNLAANEQTIPVGYAGLGALPPALPTMEISGGETVTAVNHYVNCER